MRATHEFEEGTFWAYEPVGGNAFTIHVVASDPEIEMIN
jgi:hypothetical protein